MSGGVEKTNFKFRGVGENDVDTTTRTVDRCKTIKRGNKMRNHSHKNLDLKKKITLNEKRNEIISNKTTMEN